jgi:ubiquinone biosynthesis monooxygenase Coq7
MASLMPSPRRHPDTGLGARIMKVNHAGEQGAIHIYAGQIAMARYTAPDLVDALREFKAHEEGHRRIFECELARRGEPRCRSYWLCAAGGLALGLLTGLLGRRAIAATTVAVERVVLRHLRHQLDVLGEDIEARKAVLAILADEQEHHDRAAHASQAGRFWPAVLGPVVEASTEAVIWLGMRL